MQFNHILGSFKGPNEAAILKRLKAPKYFQELRKKNSEITKKKLQVTAPETLIIQAQGAVDDVIKSISRLAKRLRDWYEIYLPEFSKSIQSHEKFAEIIQKKSKKDLLKELKLKDSVGANLEKEDLAPMLELAKSIMELDKVKGKQEAYIAAKLQKIAPNTTELVGAPIAAQLIAHAGSIKRLALFPASTIQLLGAEQALFRHLKTNAKPPKHGLIIAHPFVSNAPKKLKGKAARILADKIAIAARVDFFKGKPIGKKLAKELENKRL